jgi:hypothetical protein
MIYTSKVQKAIRFSIKTHEVYQKQKRKGKDIPYITHPLSVGLILALSGAKEEVVIAGILHDTIEDSTPKKKVTKAMLTKRFGREVSDLVASVSETDKSLSWDERKKEALAHIEKFSNNSILLKSADIISNASELLEDIDKEGEKVFIRFNAPKGKILQHYLMSIATLIRKWGESPLTGDLSFIAGRLQMLNFTQFTPDQRAKGIEYKEYNEDMPLECPMCHWKGTPKTSQYIEYYDDLLDVSCPICDKMLLIVSYPLA